ncbi:NAD(P)-dependent oxidoreductase [Microbulbifer taiwanensis]|uniref:NAD(P)-dependent oxidoreductase n=1 Tax=Microbulbifer taiwanensis TaxID=986746 RepID=A0ABW1YP23_9GAMM|nr:NAD(P)-binding oxidoreductase [Microbulbifer taiwanensis]
MDSTEVRPVTALVVGASGATGQLLVRQLLERGANVRTIVRSPEGLPQDFHNHERLTITQASLLELSDGEMSEQVRDCDAVASCLGHNLSFKGVYGHPRRLVTDATRRLCNAVRANGPQGPVRFVLMNTAGNSNRDIPERVSFAQRCLVGLIRVLLPPHPDNERAADFLRTEVGRRHACIEWSVVRPDSLIDEDKVSEYDVRTSPTRSAIFDPGKTSRINVGHFMAELITNEQLWRQWEGQMPVLYNREPLRQSS